MSTGLKLKLKIGGNAVTPRPAGPSNASGAAPPLRAPSISSPAPTSEHRQHKEKKKKKKRHRDEDGWPAHPSGSHRPSQAAGGLSRQRRINSHSLPQCVVSRHNVHWSLMNAVRPRAVCCAAPDPSSSAQPAASGAPAPIKLTIKGFQRPAPSGAPASAPLSGGAADQLRPKKKRKKERDGGGGGSTLGAGASQHTPLRKLRLQSSSGGWDQQLAQAAAAAAVAAAEQGRPGPASFRMPGAGGSCPGAKGVQKPKKKNQKPAGSAAAPEVRKPPARVRRASARSESFRDERSDGYEAATPDPLRRPGQGFAPPPKGAAAARPATSAAKAASSQDQVSGWSVRIKHRHSSLGCFAECGAGWKRNFAFMHQKLHKNR